MISHEHRCIFVHIPKTAGNSVNRVFGVGWENHKDLQRYFDELPWATFESYFKFAIVRNPWDRLLSDYNYQRKKSRARSSKLFVFAADGSERNFAEWVETALSAPAAYEAETWGGSVSPHIHRWSPQIDWMTVDGECRTDFVARLERLPEDFRTVCRQLDLPSARLPHRNRRLHLHYSRYYDRTTRELVANYYARDIEHFDYEFEQALFRIAFNWLGARRTAEAGAHPAPPANAENVGDTAGAPCTVSFATTRPPTRVSIWRRRPELAAAASFALVAGVFALTSLATSLSAADTSAPATAVQQSVRQIIVRSTAPVSDRVPNGFYAQVHRFRRTMSELNLSFDVLPAISPGGIVTISSEPDANQRGFDPVSALTVSRGGSGPAPRWWVRRNRLDQDN